MFFSAITNNLDREILTKNLIAFERWVGAKDGKFEYGGLLKNPRGEGVTKNQYIGR